ncbi:hypothetical protein Tco_1419062 [Tanacetum coccineum]|uniref:Uncharacterized protein n=1 Tax=Tanacetum coccineum TaxID=301880 RepID=A0ABQ4ZG43_9ASTR
MVRRMTLFQIRYRNVLWTLAHFILETFKVVSNTSPTLSIHLKGHNTLVQIPPFAKRTYYNPFQGRVIKHDTFPTWNSYWFRFSVSYTLIVGHERLHPLLDLICFLSVFLVSVWNGICELLQLGKTNRLKARTFSLSFDPILINVVSGHLMQFLPPLKSPDYHIHTNYLTGLVTVYLYSFGLLTAIGDVSCAPSVLRAMSTSCNSRTLQYIAHCDFLPLSLDVRHFSATCFSLVVQEALCMVSRNPPQGLLISEPGVELVLNVKNGDKA